jgi:tetrahydromethanopterin S-methyltransferase subunit A
VEVVDLVGQEDTSHILEASRGCAARNPGLAPIFAEATVVTPTRGYLLDRMVSDPAGYFVIYPDRFRQLLSLEHYTNDGMLDAVVEGKTAPELYSTAIDKALVSRLDHAAYLGRELARAEQALASGDPFIQDAAPENPSSPPASTACGCESGSKHGDSKDGAT